MAWRRSGDMPLSEPMMTSLLTHICVTQPQWVNCSLRNSPVSHTRRLRQHSGVNESIWDFLACLTVVSYISLNSYIGHSHRLYKVCMILTHFAYIGACLFWNQAIATTGYVFTPNTDQTFFECWSSNNLIPSKWWKLKIFSMYIFLAKTMLRFYQIKTYNCIRWFRVNTKMYCELCYL